MLLSLEDEVFDKMLQKAKSVVTLELVISLKANQCDDKRIVDDLILLSLVL